MSHGSGGDPGAHLAGTHHRDRGRAAARRAEPALGRGLDVEEVDEGSALLRAQQPLEVLTLRGQAGLTPLGQPDPDDLEQRTLGRDARGPPHALAGRDDRVDLRRRGRRVATGARTARGCERHGGREQGVGRHDPVDQAQALGLVGDDGAAGHHELDGVGRSNPAQQQLGSAAAGDQAEGRLGKPEHRSVAHDEDAAAEGDLECAAQRITVDGGHERLRRVGHPGHRLVDARQEVRCPRVGGECRQGREVGAPAEGAGLPRGEDQAAHDGSREHGIHDDPQLVEHAGVDDVHGPARDVQRRDRDAVLVTDGEVTKRSRHGFSSVGWASRAAARHGKGLGHRRLNSVIARVASGEAITASWLVISASRASAREVSQASVSSRLVPESAAGDAAASRSARSERGLGQGRRRARPR